MNADKHNPPTSHAPLVAGAPHHGPTEGADVKSVGETLSGLADRLRRAGVWNFKLLGVVVLAAVAVFVWRYLASNKASAASAEWVRLEGANSIPALEEVAKGDPNGVPGHVAELHEARYRLGGPNKGIEGLQSSDPKTRKEAVEDIEKARDSFVRLADVFKADQTLHPQCLYGAAKAEEALVRIPKDGKPDEYRGTIERTIELLDQVAKAAGKTPMGVEAQKQADLLRQNGASREYTLLQTELNNKLSAKPASADQFPLGPGGSLPALPGGDPKLPPSATQPYPIPTTPPVSPNTPPGGPGSPTTPSRPPGPVLPLPPTGPTAPPLPPPTAPTLPPGPNSPPVPTPPPGPGPNSPPVPTPPPGLTPPKG